MLLLVASCGEPVPFNVNLLLILPPDPLQGTLEVGGQVDLPAQADTALGDFTWRIPLHDLRESVDIATALPDAGIVEASLTLALVTDTVPPDASLDVAADARMSVYVAPAGEELWADSRRSSAQAVELFGASAAVITIPLTQEQVAALGAPFAIGVELTAAQVVITSTASESLLLDALSYSFEALRIEGFGEPGALF